MSTYLRLCHMLFLIAWVIAFGGGVVRAADASSGLAPGDATGVTPDKAIDGTRGTGDLVGPNSISRKPYRVVMVLWRGKTAAEQGFEEYLARRKVPVELTVLDCETDKSRLPGFIEQIRTMRPDLVYTFGTTVTVAIAGTIAERDPARHITDIPIVFGLVATPVESGLIAAMGPSGTNLTGVCHLAPIEAQLQMIRSMVTLRRLGVVYNPAEDNAVQQVELLARLSEKSMTPENDADEPGFELVRQPVDLDEAGAPYADRITAAVERFRQAPVDMVFIPSDSFLLSHDVELTEAINALGVPSCAAVEKYVRHGDALMGLVSNYRSVGRFLGHKAAEILVRKRAPGLIPVEPLRQFTLLFNMRIAHRLRCYPSLKQLGFAEVIKVDEPQPDTKPNESSGLPVTTETGAMADLTGAGGNHESNMGDVSLVVLTEGGRASPSQEHPAGVVPSVRRTDHMAGTNP